MAKKVAKKAEAVPNPFRPQIRTERIELRLSAAEKKRLRDAAKKAGKSMTAYLVSRI